MRQLDLFPPAPLSVPVIHGDWGRCLAFRLLEGVRCARFVRRNVLVEGFSCEWGRTFVLFKLDELIDGGTISSLSL